MNEKQIMIGLVAGFLPFRVVFNNAPCGFRVVHLRAIFWNLTIVKCCGCHAWLLQVPLIEKMRDLAYAVVTQLRDKPSL